MVLLRLIAAAVAGWLVWKWLLRPRGRSGEDRRASAADARRDERYRELTDQPIEDADFEEIRRE